jgi:hypothetical protein
VLFGAVRCPHASPFAASRDTFCNVSRSELHIGVNEPVLHKVESSGFVSRDSWGRTQYGLTDRNGQRGKPRWKMRRCRSVTSIVDFRTVGRFST